MSSDLLWTVVRKNNAFMKTNRCGAHEILSKERGNLMNKHSYKYSGLVNHKAIHITAGTRGVDISTKRNHTRSQPNKQFTKIAHKKGARATNSAIIGVVAKTFYRGDLKQAALARVSKIGLSQKNRKPKVRSIKNRKNRTA